METHQHCLPARLRQPPAANDFIGAGSSPEYLLTELPVEIRICLEAFHEHKDLRSL